MLINLLLLLLLFCAFMVETSLLVHHIHLPGPGSGLLKAALADLCHRLRNSERSKTSGNDGGPKPLLFLFHSLHRLTIHLQSSFRFVHILSRLVQSPGPANFPVLSKYIHLLYLSASLSALPGNECSRDPHPLVFEPSVAPFPGSS